MNIAEIARRANVSFTPDAADLYAIARICRLVEGMPLAIELAASWVRVLTCAEIAAETERDWGFLSGASRDMPARHRSLRAVFDQSWALLGEDERRILRDLSAYKVDGVFYDGPVFRADTCYCSHCRARYRKEHGEEMPSKKLRTGPAFKKLLDFQARSMADFLRESNAVIKSLNPNAAFYMNGGVRGAKPAEIGPVSEYVLKHAPCRVLLTAPPGE